MFEIVGMLFVAWVAWKGVKAVLEAAVNRTLVRAVGYAAERGVPHDASAAILDQPALVKRVRRDLARASQEFAALDGFEQYGKAITVLHAARQGHFDEKSVESDPLLRYEHTKNAELEIAKEKVKRLLDPQLAALKREGVPVRVDYITFAYVGALAWSTSKVLVNATDIKCIVEHCFQGKHYVHDIAAVWDNLQDASDLEDKSNALGSISDAENAAGKGEFFARFTRKHSRSRGLTAGPRPDLSKVRDDWFLEV